MCFGMCSAWTDAEAIWPYRRAASRTSEVICGLPGRDVRCMNQDCWVLRAVLRLRMATAFESECGSDHRRVEELNRYWA